MSIVAGSIWVVLHPALVHFPIVLLIVGGLWEVWGYLGDRESAIRNGGRLTVLGTLALIGSNLISFSTSRAANLDLDVGRPTLASKGTRTTVTAICGVGSLFWKPLPLVALVYLVVHTNGVMLYRLIRTLLSASKEPL